MKKLTYISVLAMGLALAACDDYKEPNPPAQSNPKPSVLEVKDIEVTGEVTATSTFNLAELNDAGENIVIASVGVVDFPVGYELGAVAEISANDFSSAFPVAASVVAAETPDFYNVVIAPDDLEGVYAQHISKSPNAKEIGVRFVLTAVSGSQVAYIGGTDNYYKYEMTVVPFPSEIVIEDAYYLIGTIDDWSVVGAVKLNHSSESVYDDPVFSIKIDITPDAAAAGWWWKVIPQSTYALGDWSDADYSQFGVAENGSPEHSGMLVPKLNGVDPGAGDFQEAGSWLFSINMMESTYEFSLAIDQLYTPGDANGWSQTASQILTTTNYASYTGYAVLSSSGFKFSSQPDWNGINYGASAEEGVLDTDGGAGNLSVETTGLYWCNVNLPALTYTTTLINTIGVIGDATPAGWDASTPLNQGADFLTWTGDITFGSGEWKFRANDGWDINLGGELENLTQDGANLPSPGAGTYTVTLDLSQVPYSCQLVKK